MTIYTNPKIYVADLAAYNSRHSHGVWIEVTKDEDAIQEQIQLMLKDSPVEDAEEWTIHDFECIERVVKTCQYICLLLRVDSKYICILMIGRCIHLS